MSISAYEGRDWASSPHPSPRPGARAAMASEKRVAQGQEPSVSTTALYPVPARDTEPGSLPPASPLPSKCGCFSIPRGHRASHCFVSLGFIAQLGGASFHQPFSMSLSQSLSSLHPNIRTPAYNIQHFLPCKHYPHLSSSATTSLLFHL